MSRTAFCDNKDCHTWFTVPNAQERGDGTVGAPDGIRFDERVTRVRHAMHAFRVNTYSDEEWSTYMNAHPLVVQEKP